MDYSKKPSASIMDSIKARSQVSPASSESYPAPWDSSDSAPKITADVQSAKLKQLLGKIKTTFDIHAIVCGRPISA
jgi:hypothetical protein